MSEQVRILSFYENWVDIMEMCNPEEWYELSTIITNLRFKNIDTDPKTLTNIKVKMAWTAIRPSILKSNRNTRYQENKAKKNTDITPNEEFDNTLTTGFPTKEEEQQTDTKEETQSQTIDSSNNFDNYSEDLNDLQKNDFKASTSHVNNTDDTNYQNTIESASEAKEMGNTGIFQDDELIGTLKNEQFEVLNDNFDNYSERLYNLIDDNITKIRQSTDILAQKQIELGSQMDNTVAFHRNVLYDLRKELGWDTKDGIDFQQFIDEEINRKIAEKRYERAVQSSYNS